MIGNGCIAIDAFLQMNPAAEHNIHRQCHGIARLAAGTLTMRPAMSLKDRAAQPAGRRTSRSICLRAHTPLESRSVAPANLNTCRPEKCQAVLGGKFRQETVTVRNQWPMCLSLKCRSNEKLKLRASGNEPMVFEMALE
jgi:hypothetical protein